MFLTKLSIFVEQKYEFCKQFIHLQIPHLMLISRDISQRKHCNQRILIPYNLKNYLIQHLLYN